MAGVTCAIWAGVRGSLALVARARQLTPSAPTDLVVLFPFRVPIYLPRRLVHAFLDALSALRIIAPRDADDEPRPERPPYGENGNRHDEPRSSGKAPPPVFVRLSFPLNMVTAPLIADLFLLAILAIGREEVRDGTLGANHILPIDIMLFFITLAYIAISIDASGLIRYLAFKVLEWGGTEGHRLFFYLYVFFFALGSFVGNDPIILSGTAFLAYMTRVSSNIVHPRAWIYTQFAVANIASAILVSSNPTNLVLAGAFQIKFIVYTAHMVVPVIVTGVVLFPFLLYIVFNDEALIPHSIKMHALPEEIKSRKPVNPNIPHVRGAAEQQENAPGEDGKLLSLEEIMNPFLDKSGAAFGGVLIAVTLISVLALNAAKQSIGEIPVFYVTLPAAAIMFAWDLGYGWINRRETREIARKNREQLERAKLERALREEEEKRKALAAQGLPRGPSSDGSLSGRTALPDGRQTPLDAPLAHATTDDELTLATNVPEKVSKPDVGEAESNHGKSPTTITLSAAQIQKRPKHTTLVSLSKDFFRWSQETFPTATAVIAHLPFALIPFAFAMFILVQALVTKGWVQVFALGWDKWVKKTGTIGAIGGMGFISVVLCNVRSS